MNIDTLNAYCRFVLVTNLPLGQGRLHNIHQGIFHDLPCIVPSPALSGVGPSCTLQCLGLLSTLGIPSRVVRGCLLLMGPGVWGAGCKSSPSVADPNFFRPDLKGDYPPNLSILISGGKENNCDSPSNGE